jgi:hypothetical protein
MGKRIRGHTCASGNPRTGLKGEDSIDSCFRRNDKKRRR